MRTAIWLSVALCVVLLLQTAVFGEDVLFEDEFREGLTAKWQAVGLAESDYRLRNGGLEMRVQPGELTPDTPMLKVLVPMTCADTVIASVRITLLDEFTQEHELAGMCLIDGRRPEFAAKKEMVSGKVVFSPGTYQFEGKEGEEDRLDRYRVAYTPATAEAGPVRITVSGSYAHFHVGPSTSGAYRYFFHSAICDSKKRGFCLVAAGAPEGVSHWVRFEDFRVVKE